MLIKKASVRVPGTTANLGPGYDCLGIALSLYNILKIERGPAQAPQPMVDQAAKAFFSTCQHAPFSFSWNISGEVPRSRGLGSSVTVRLGLLQGLNELCGLPLRPKEIFLLCAGLEGHPDNAAPAAFGGFTVARASGQISRFEVDEKLQFVLLIPDFEMETSAARQVLPSSLPISDAVAALGNACAITAAFAGKDYTKLKGTFHDTIHQPYRTPLIPFLPKVIAAAEAEGALGGFLSGSGSTIAAVTLGNANAIAGVMAAAAGLSTDHTRIVHADNRGLQTLEVASD